MSTLSRALTVDLPEPLYENACQVARDLGVSLASFARDAIAEKTRGLKGVDLASAYETLADDTEESDIERFFSFQAETLAG